MLYQVDEYVHDRERVLVPKVLGIDRSQLAATANH